MMDVAVHPVRCVKGRFRPPPGRELAHLAAVLSLRCPGRCTIDNWPTDDASASVLQCLRQLGAQVTIDGAAVRIEGAAARRLSPPGALLECGNATAAFPLLAGLLCGRPFPSTMSGGGTSAANVVSMMLQQMGAVISQDDRFGKLNLAPAVLHGAEMSTTSALPWGKMAALMAGLLVEGKTSVTEGLPLPDDLERVLPAYGVTPEVVYPPRRAPRREEILESAGETREVEKFHKRITVRGPVEGFRPVDWVLPGDFSLAAPLIAAATLLPKSELLIEDVALNPSRAGFLKVLKRLGAEITTYRRRMENGVPVGDISVVGSALKATKVPPAEIPSLVAELPLLTVLAGSAFGVTVIRGVRELKDVGVLPLGLITENLRRMSVKVAELEDGWAIEGPTEWHAAEIDCGGNEAVGMAFAVAGALAEKQTTIHRAECVTSRFPDLQRVLLSLSAK